MMIHSNAQQHMFLDLEETVIDSWDSAKLLMTNCRAIRRMLKSRGVNEVTIFSFAVQTPEEREEAMTHLRPRLEKVLDVKIVDVILVQQMQQADQQWRKCRLDDMTEFIMLRGKTDAFFAWASLKHPGEQCTLIDDVVPNSESRDWDTDTVVEFRNIEQVRELWRTLNGDGL